MKGLYRACTDHTAGHKNVGSSSSTIIRSDFHCHYQSDVSISQSNVAFPRKKSPNQYYYFLPSDVSFINQLPSQFIVELNFIRSTSCSLQQQQQQYHDVTLTAVLERSIRTVLRLFNDRIGQIWTLKEINQSMRHVTLLLMELDNFKFSIKHLIQFLIREVEPLKVTLSLRSLVNEVDSRFIAALEARLNLLCWRVARKTATDAVRSYLNGRQKEFLVIWSDRQSSRTNRNDNEPLSQGATNVALVNTSCCLCPYFSSATTKQLQSQSPRLVNSEHQLFQLLERSSLEPFKAAIQHVHEHFSSLLVGQQFDTPALLSTAAAGCSERLLEGNRFAHCMSIVLNASLEALLDSILEEGLMFDEAGVYKLFRIVLRLQESAADIKKSIINSSMGAPGCQRDPTNIYTQLLITDVSQWKRAELVLQALNEAIFAVKQSETSVAITAAGSRIRPKAGSDAAFAATTVDIVAESPAVDEPNQSDNCYLVEEERHRWVHLATSRNKSGGRNIFNAIRYWRKRHKGTVFVSLQINLNNL